MNAGIVNYEPRGEVATFDPTGGRLVAWAEAAGAAHSLAVSLSSTTFVPKHFQGKPGDATAAIILGDELGLSPLSALRSIHVISGTPGLYARTMAALVLSHGHKIWTEEETEQSVTVAGQRRGSDRVERVTWTIARATKAGYTSNAKYKTDPIAMLYARASGDVARRIAPDVLAGVPYSVEEIELSEVETTTVSRAPAAPRTVARKTKPEPVEPEFDDEPQTTPEAVEPEDHPAPSGDGITKAQQTKLHAGLGNLGIGGASNRDVALRYVGDVLGRVIESTKDLSKDEASRVIEAIEAEIAAPSGDPS